MGHPLGGSLCFESAYIEKSESKEKIVVEALCQAGASGGPLFDSNGRVLGILSRGILKKSICSSVVFGFWPRVASWRSTTTVDKLIADLKTMREIMITPKK